MRYTKAYILEEELEGMNSEESSHFVGYKKAKDLTLEFPDAPQFETLTFDRAALERLHQLLTHTIPESEQKGRLYRTLDEALSVLEKECTMMKPLTMEEAEREFNAAPDIPLSEEERENIIKRVLEKEVEDE